MEWVKTLYLIIFSFVSIAFIVVSIIDEIKYIKEDEGFEEEPAFEIKEFKSSDKRKVVNQ